MINKYKRYVVWHIMKLNIKYSERNVTLDSDACVGWTKITFFFFRNFNVNEYNANWFSCWKLNYSTFFYMIFKTFYTCIFLKYFNKLRKTYKGMQEKNYIYIESHILYTVCVRSVTIELKNILTNVKIKYMSSKSITFILNYFLTLF